MTGYSRNVARAGNPKIMRAAKALSKTLSAKGIKHALIGGLAVGIYGYERATNDADFLISGASQEAVAGDMLGGEVHGKTIVFHDVIVDLLFPSPDQRFLEADIKRAGAGKNKLPIIPSETLIYMKLIASRAKDNADVVELLKRGKIDSSKVISYLKKRRPDLIEDFESLVSQAEHEPR